MHPVGSRHAAALAVLGLSPDADPGQVGRAYRRLARTTHPDVSTSPDAADRFDHLAEAYRLALEVARARATRPAPPPAAETIRPWRPPRSAGSAPDAPIVAGPVQVRPLPPREPR